MKLYGINELIKKKTLSLGDFSIKDVTMNTKGGGKMTKSFIYLNWAKALAIYTQNGGTYNLHQFDETGTFWKKLEDNSVLIYIDFEFNEQKLTTIYPVLDFKNAAAKNPSAADINNAKQRALVKGIAEISGLGLELWSDPKVMETLLPSIRKVQSYEIGVEAQEMMESQREETTLDLSINKIKKHLESVKDNQEKEIIETMLKDNNKAVIIEYAKTLQGEK